MNETYMIPHGTHMEAWFDPLERQNHVRIGTVHWRLSAEETHDRLMDIALDPRSGGPEIMIAAIEAVITNGERV